MQWRNGMVVLGVALAMATPAEAKLKVVTTITDLAAVVKEVGGPEVEVDSIARGTQDPHFIEAKPSYMVKASRADLIVAMGLELEQGWLPSILRGARNPKVMPGAPGYVEAGAWIEPLEVPTGKLTRADGDVHGGGNPHFNLDPERMATVAIKLGEKLGELSPTQRADFKARAEKMRDRLLAKTKEWQARVVRSGVKQVVTYHKTLTYFLARFGIANPEILEPKPGIPPTSAHIIHVIEVIRARKVPLVLVENYFDDSVIKKIRSAIPEIRSRTVPVLVEGAEGIATLDDLYETLIKAVESGGGQ
ncbi:MAG: metal ABC transporter substrate-binding protein [Bacteriovoracia bacterium]